MNTSSTSNAVRLPSIKNHLYQQMFLGDVQIKESQHQDGTVTVLVTAHEGGRVLFNEENPDTRQIFTELTVTTTHSFGGELDESSRDGTLYHVQDHDELVILYDRQGPAGFASGFSQGEFLYLHGIAIAPRAKGLGAGRRMVEALRKASGRQGITFTTQNPVMFCLLRSICADAYPNPEYGVPEHLQPQVAMLAHDRPGSLDATTGVIRDLYGRCLYPELPESKDAAVNTWFAKTLEVSEGKTRHAFLFVGHGLR